MAPKASSAYTRYVTEAAQKLFDEALALPERERLALAEALFDSLPREDQAKVDEAWRVELLARMEQVRKGDVQLESWDEVRQAGHRALGQR
jgi:putative addiction module component (TIGR02574 family)